MLLLLLSHSAYLPGCTLNLLLAKRISRNIELLPKNYKIQHFPTPPKHHASSLARLNTLGSCVYLSTWIAVSCEHWWCPLHRVCARHLLVPGAAHPPLNILITYSWTQIICKGLFYDLSTLLSFFILSLDQNSFFLVHRANKNTLTARL